MMQLPYRLIWGQLSRHRSEFGAQRCLHKMTITPPSTVPTLPPVPPSQGKEVKEIQIPVPWGHISGKWWGRTDVRPVLMLHGWQDNAGTFDTLAPLLDNEALLAVEMVGHGRSSHYPLGQCYAFSDGLVTLRRIVRHFGWEGTRVSLIGHSLGSVIAFTYAGVFPDNVESLVCLDCPRGSFRALTRRFPSGADLRQAIEATLSLERRGQRAWRTMEEIIEHHRKGSNYSVSRERTPAIVARGLVESVDQPGRFEFARDPRLRNFAWTSAMFSECMCTLSAQITCSVLDVRATDSFTSSLEAVALYERSMAIVGANARRHERSVLEGTHHVHLNAPEIVAPIVNNFFARKDYDVIY